MITMKTFFKILTFVILSVGFSSCNEDDEPIVAQLEINYANLNGTWQLVQWNGASLADGSYCYIQLNRKDHTFKLYHNMDSMYARLITGTFNLENSPNLGYIISGEYDYGQGSWNAEYIITDLLETGSMIWTVNGDAHDVSLYKRCDAIPDNILAEVGEVEE